MSESWESSADLTGQIVGRGEFPVASGGFGDIWKCTWRRPTSDPVEVAVKVIRTHTSGNDDRNKMSKRLRREIGVWQRLNHKNIVPLFGVTSDFGPLVSMVCPWLENGSLSHYLKSCHTHLTLKDRFQLLDDIAAGLQYLHTCLVIHGDLSSSNVLVDRNRNACLADFGLSIVIREFPGTSDSTSPLKGALRWAAPEIFVAPDSEDTAPCHPTKKSDIYSFGSVMLQVISGSAPYSDLNDAQVLRKIFKRVTPTRPRSPEIDDRHWTFIQQCWSESDISRPTATEAIEFCEGELYALNQTDSGADAKNEPIEPSRDGGSETPRLRDDMYISPSQERGEHPAIPVGAELPTIPDQNVSEVGAVVESPTMPATMRKPPILNPDVLEVKPPHAHPSDHNSRMALDNYPQQHYGNTQALTWEHNHHGPLHQSDGSWNQPQPSPFPPPAIPQPADSPSIFHFCQIQKEGACGRLVRGDRNSLRTHLARHHKFNMADKVKMVHCTWGGCLKDLQAGAHVLSKHLGCRWDRSSCEFRLSRPEDMRNHHKRSEHEQCGAATVLVIPGLGGT